MEKLSNNVFEYVGELRDGVPHGQGTISFVYGDKYIGEFKDGVPHGQGTISFGNGDKYVGEFKDDMFDGQGTITYANGDKYVGEFRDDKRHGQGTFTFTSGDKYIGNFKDDLFDGQGTYIYGNGDKYVGEFKEGSALNAFYYIDQADGTTPIGDLPIGTRVVDNSWVWEFRNDFNYTGSGVVMPVPWIVVAKDHYSGLRPHVTLLADWLIGLFAFDDSTNRGSQYGCNHWGDSGKDNAKNGLRPWLNSTGIHAGEGFYQAFSENFKDAVLATTVPNKVWENASNYNTSDNVFIPSTIELGETHQYWTHKIGEVYTYFQGSNVTSRQARLDRGLRWYWTRSPAGNDIHLVRGIFDDDELIFHTPSLIRRCLTCPASYGVRPVLNLKSEILVAEILD